MRLAFVTVFADDACQVQLRRRNSQADFFGGLPTGAGVRRFACLSLQLPAAGAPETEVRFLAPLEQQNLIALVEAIEQSGDLVGQRHAGSEAGSPGAGKGALPSDTTP